MSESDIIRFFNFSVCRIKVLNRVKVFQFSNHRPDQIFVVTYYGRFYIHSKYFHIITSLKFEVWYFNTNFLQLTQYRILRKSAKPLHRFFQNFRNGKKGTALCRGSRSFPLWIIRIYRWNRKLLTAPKDNCICFAISKLRQNCKSALADFFKFLY